MRYIDYEKKSFTNTFAKFYKVFNHEHNQKAPTFVQSKKWSLHDGKGLPSAKWLRY